MNVRNIYYYIKKRVIYKSILIFSCKESKNSAILIYKWAFDGKVIYLLKHFRK